VAKQKHWYSIIIGKNLPSKANIIEKCLYQENILTVKKIAVELLLKFLSDLDTPESPYSSLLSAAIDLPLYPVIILILKSLVTGVRFLPKVSQSSKHLVGTYI
jgi:hypothetical protein